MIISCKDCITFAICKSQAYEVIQIYVNSYKNLQANNITCSLFLYKEEMSIYDAIDERLKCKCTIYNESNKCFLDRMDMLKILFPIPKKYYPKKREGGFNALSSLQEMLDKHNV